MSTAVPATFRLTEPASSAGEAGLLGIWATAPLDEAADFSLDSAAPDSTLWLADLPADPSHASHVLLTAERSLTLADLATTSAEERMMSFVDRVQKTGAVAFNLVEDAGRPEQELDRLLASLAPDPQIASFGLGDQVRGALSQAGQQFEAYLERLEQQLSHFAWVETRSAGRLTARTAVDWTGNLETRWYGVATPPRTVLHRRTLTLALQSRYSLLRTLAVVTRNAIRLAKLPVLLTTPGGALLALPLAWRFIQDLRGELT